MALPTENWQTGDTRALFEAFLALTSVDEAEDFIRDLCTRREIDEMSHRWAVVRLLATGLPYREIAERTGASTATISRINQWLQHGTGGYRRMIDRLTEGPA